MLKGKSWSAEVLRNFEKAVMLQTLDGLWKGTWRPWITASGHPSARLRPEEPQAGVQARILRSVHQMLETLKRDVVSIPSRVQVQERDVEAMEEQQRQQAGAPAPRTYTHCRQKPAG